MDDEIERLHLQLSLWMRLALTTALASGLNGVATGLILGADEGDSTWPAYLVSAAAITVTFVGWGWARRIDWERAGSRATTVATIASAIATIATFILVLVRDS